MLEVKCSVEGIRSERKGVRHRSDLCRGTLDELPRVKNEDKGGRGPAVTGPSARRRIAQVYDSRRDGSRAAKHLGLKVKRGGGGAGARCSEQIDTSSTRSRRVG
ncbi:hypothetical protein EYF80_062783 [Liparis tanakae]|uniref:Uncharacterized protein n=1 Tax=Liparis tanakae TaxID=230148 RepID=A0A4Z2EF02_9TELE|nr:hypothetical protein EYF80_062783 [Liparis tanakae]